MGARQLRRPDGDEVDICLVGVGDVSREPQPTRGQPGAEDLEEPWLEKWGVTLRERLGFSRIDIDADDVVANGGIAAAFTAPRYPQPMTDIRSVT